MSWCHSYSFSSIATNPSKCSKQYSYNTIVLHTLRIQGTLPSNKHQTLKSVPACFTLNVLHWSSELHTCDWWFLDSNGLFISLYISVAVCTQPFHFKCTLLQVGRKHLNSSLKLCVLLPFSLVARWPTLILLLWSFVSLQRGAGIPLVLPTSRGPMGDILAVVEAGAWIKRSLWMAVRKAAGNPCLVASLSLG